MNNEIERKTTSLILMTIMVAGGLTFAIPSTVPDAHAQTPNLYVSAVSSTFENTFGGSQIVEVIVNDPQLDDTTDLPPAVTVNDDPFTMRQATDGSWYGYFAVNDPTTTNIDPVRDSKARSGNGANPGDIDTIQANVVSGIETGDSFDVVYNKGGNRQVVTLTYDDSTNNDISLDRTVYPRMSQIYVEITDHVLNIDPTDADVWTFDLTAGTIRYNENITKTATADMHEITNLGCDDDCLFSITNSSGIVKVMDNNEITNRPANNDNMLITIEETGPNTGVFTIDADDKSQIMTTDNNLRGVTATFTYDDIDVQIQQRLSTATIDLDISDGTWNSGEPIDLTVVDADQNLNSEKDEDQTVDNPDARIPIFMTGDPYTLADGVDSKNQNMSIYAYTENTRANSIMYTQDATQANVERLDYQVDDSHRGIISLDEDKTLNTPRIAIPFGTFGELRKSINDDNLNDGDNVNSTFVGRNLINYDFSVFGDENIRSDIMLVADNGTVIRYGTIGIVHSALTTYDRQADIRDITGWGLAPTGGTNLVISGPEILNDPNIDANTKVMLVLTLSSNLEIKAGDRYPIVTDFFSFGFYGDGAQANERVANQIIRVEVEETGDNTSTFTGTLEYVMINQLDAAAAENVPVISATDLTTLAKPDHVYINIEPISNEAKFVAFEDLTGSDARVNYNDLDANGNPTIVSDQQDITTSTGVVSLNAETYSVGSNVVITLEDADLNTDSGSRETYTVVNNNAADKDTDQVGIDVSTDLEEKLPGDYSLGMLLEVTIDGERWQGNTCTGTDNTLDSGVQNGLAATGFTLQETGDDTGVFTGSFTIPKERCMIGNNANSTAGVSGKDIGVTYVDFRDASGQIVTVGDSAAIGASTGSISLDRTVYPVPYGASTAAGGSMFKDHDDDPLTASTATVTIQVNDPDYNLRPTGEDKIEVATGNGPVEITVTRSGNECVIGHAGSDISNANSELDRLRTAFTTAKTAYDANPTDNTLLDTFTRAQANYQNALNTGGACPISQPFGPLVETSPESGIFEVSIPISYNQGPSSSDCPSQTQCILQGDIITVQYTDPTDASGNERTVTDSATFDLRNGALQTDKSVYVIGTDMIVTLIDPDLDLDSGVRETYPLNIINWDSDAGTAHLDDRIFDAEPGSLRETGPSTGIFQVVIEVPSAIGNERLQRGEEITLQYVDYGPSGADYVGDNTEDIERTVFTSNFGATIELDQAVYTWTDKVFITITAPDHNLNSNQVDEIGNNDDYPIRVATRSDSIDEYTLVETGTNTGIFTGELILTGFSYDADGDSTTGTNGNDVSGATCANCNGPTDGMLPTDNDDGLEVSFEFSDGETVRKSALIRWNIGEVQWLEASYPATSSGVLRVIDADMNLNPESVDNFEVKVWSSDSPSGISLTVEETQPASGIFEGTVFFGLDVSSGGHRLNVQEGDTVTARYTDNTLPEPYSQGDSESITATTIIGTIVPPLERVGIESLRAVDATGTTLSTVSVDQQIQISADLTNKQDKDQPFAYLVQIQDADGVTVSLSWIDGSLTPNQSLSPSVSWTPTTSGTYTVTVFAWESVSTPTALSPQQQTTITVN